MLKRVHVKGYKSLADVQVELEPLTVLFGPNAAGKSNFLDALQLLSGLGTSRTLKDAFDSPYRGKPIESFRIGKKGIKGLVEQGPLSFSIEADLRLSDAVVDAVDRQIRDMRRPSRDAAAPEAGKQPARVRERDLRYRIEIEMLPKSGILRVADEYLAALNRKGEPTGKRKPFFERQGEKIHLRLEGQAHPTHYIIIQSLSRPQHPVDAALSASGSGAARTRKLAVLLLRAPGTDARRQSGQGSPPHRADGRRACGVPQHGEG